MWIITDTSHDPALSTFLSPEIIPARGVRVVSRDVVGVIDGALRDYAASADAMRWVPESERGEEPLSLASVDWGLVLRSVAATSEAVGQAFRRMFDRLGSILRQAARRRALLVRAAARLRVAGPHEFAGSDDWQSAACSAWLHDGCPNVLRPVLDCRCTCHGGHLR